MHRPSRVLKVSTLCLALIGGMSDGAYASAQEPDRVVMRLDEFMSMYERSKTKTQKPAPPRAWAIGSAEYRGEVAADLQSASFSAKMRVDILQREGWVHIPLLPATVALESAKIGGRDASVAIEGGYYYLITDRRGSQDLQLRFAASVERAEGRDRVGFEMLPSGATSLELTVPSREGVEFEVANAKRSTTRVRGEERIVEASLPSAGRLDISWQRQREEVKAQPARVYAEVQTLVAISDGLLRAQATISNTILFSGRERFEYELPEGLTVVDVRADGIREWRQSDEGKLEVDLTYPMEGSWSLQVDMERAVARGEDENILAPIVVPTGVDRIKGWLGVESRDNLEIEGVKAEGAASIDVRSLPGSILGITEQPVLLGYKYLESEVRIPLRVARHEDVDVLVTLVDQVRARTMWTPTGRRLTSVRYQVRNNRRQFLRVALPEGAQLWSAAVAGRAVQPAKAQDGRVMLPLVRSDASGGALAAFGVEIVYVEEGAAPDDRGRGRFAAELPRVDVPSTYVAWTLFAPDEVKVRARSFRGSLREVESLTNPVPDAGVNYVETMSAQMREDAQAQAGAGALGQGAAPVPVSLPLSGVGLNFERLIALDEALVVSFDYRGLR